MDERVGRSRWRRSVVLLGALAAACIAAAETPAPSAPARSRALLEAVLPLLPLAMDEARWSDPAQREAIGQGLSRLAEAAPLLDTHAATRDLAFRDLGSSLARDATRTRDLHAAKAFDEARASMVEITATCAACHARLPDSTNAAEPEFPEAALANLSLHERAQVWLAIRRFDRALEVWETALEDEMQAPGHLDMEGYLLDYMTIGLRVRRDPARVRRSFSRFAQRGDMPIYLGRHLAHWDIALAAIEEDLVSPDLLERGRALAAAEGVPRPALLGREQTVYDLAASSLLLRFIEGNTDDRERLAEAYYLLGVVEARSVDSYWLPQAEAHLEAAIRLAPASASAASAYALLEEYVVVGFGGAGEEALPSEAWEKLHDLSRRIEESRTQEEKREAPPP